MYLEGHLHIECFSRMYTNGGDILRRKTVLSVDVQVRSKQIIFPLKVFL